MAPPPVESATYGGDCGRAYARFWSRRDFTGSSVKYCWYGIGGGDSNMNGPEGTANLGPLYNGTYAPDFDTSEFGSGIGSVTFYNNPNDGLVSNLCTYYNPNFNSPYTRLYAGGNYAFPTSGPASMKWTTVTSISNC